MFVISECWECNRVESNIIVKCNKGFGESIVLKVKELEVKFILFFFFREFY